MDASLAKAKSRSKHWEREAKAGAEKIVGEEKERDLAKKEAQVARLAVVAVGDAKTRVEDDLARVQEALATRSHGERLLEGLGANFCLWLRMLCVQRQHLWRPTRGSEWYARLLRPASFRVLCEP